MSIDERSIDTVFTNIRSNLYDATNLIKKEEINRNSNEKLIKLELVEDDLFLLKQYLLHLVSQVEGYKRFIKTRLDNENKD